MLLGMKEPKKPQLTAVFLPTVWPNSYFHDGWADSNEHNPFYNLLFLCNDGSSLCFAMFQMGIFASFCFILHPIANILLAL